MTAHGSAPARIARSPSISHAHPASGGFILVAVLWILGALAALVSIYAVYVSNSAMAAAVRNEDLAARSLASAAVELAAYRLVSVPKERRPSHGEVAFRMANAEIKASYQDEAARIDLNAATKELLAGLFATLGARPEDAGHYADRILAWRAPASGAAQQDEAALYRDAGLDHGPRGGPFMHMDELWLVASLPPALVARALPYLTVYSGRADVHAHEADAVVLASLPGAGAGPAATPAMSEPSGGNGSTLLPGTTVEGGDTVRVSVRIAFDNGGTRAAEAVLLVRDFGDDPYRVLSWREDVDPGTTGSRP